MLCLLFVLCCLSFSYSLTSFKHLRWSEHSRTFLYSTSIADHSRTFFDIFFQSYFFHIMRSFASFEIIEESLLSSSSQMQYYCICCLSLSLSLFSLLSNTHTYTHTHTLDLVGCRGNQREGCITDTAYYLFFDDLK